MLLRRAAPVLAVFALLAPAAHAWDYEGHRLVNQLALAALPADFPAFVRVPATAERIAFLAGEADRWRNVPDLTLRHANGLDHYCDFEQIAIAGLDYATLPALRFEFAAQFAARRAAHPERFPVIDPAQNADRSREWCGFLPWTIAEYYGRLRSALSYWRTFQETAGTPARPLGTPAELANAEANVAYLMGVMGHFVGDGAQPLHTTRHHNGWVGDNPHGYSRWPGFHAWIDGGYLGKAGVKFADLAPRVAPAQSIAVAARPDGRDPMFVAVLDYLLGQHRLVEPLYQLEKEAKLGHGAQPLTDEARAFFEGQLLKAGAMLGAIWITAWQHPVPDTYLRGELLRRTAAEDAKSVPAADTAGKKQRKKAK